MNAITTPQIATKSSAVSVQNVRKVYQRDSQQLTVLDGINLEVPAGEFVALMGPSGSGKTTLLNLIAGIDRPTSGKVVVANTDLTPLSEGELAKWRSHNIGFIFQFYNLIPVLNAIENVELPLLLTSLSSKERRERAMTALRIVGLDDRYKHYPRQLSGGQEQRVAIARAIVTDPSVLVADEPTGDLDSKSAEEILDLMQTFNKEFGKTILMVTHDPRAAERARIQHHLEKGVLRPDMKYAPLVLKHLRKNWIRTLSTVLAMSVCIFLFCVLQTVIAAVNFGLTAGNTNRLVTRDYVSLANLLPINYKQKIAAVPGVKDTVIVSWFGGQYGDSKNFFTNFAVEPEAFLRVYPEIMLPEDQKQKWLGDVRGCIIGRKLAERFHWTIGEHLPARKLHSVLPRRQAIRFRR